MVIIYYLGKSLQALALVQVAVALIIGLQTSDPTLELKILASGVVEFLLGFLILKVAAKSES